MRSLALMGKAKKTAAEDGAAARRSCGADVTSRVMPSGA
jgi:hypothetical protein